MQEYISNILENKELKKDEEVRKTFKLHTFFDQLEKDKKLYEVIAIPD